MRIRRAGEEIVVMRFWKIENRWTNSNRTSISKEAEFQTRNREH